MQAGEERLSRTARDLLSISGLLGMDKFDCEPLIEDADQGLHLPDTSPQEWDDNDDGGPSSRHENPTVHVNNKAFQQTGAIRSTALVLYALS